MSKKNILLFLAVLSALFCRAAIKYNVLSSANGLSNSSVNCIYQDSRMLLWIGTWDGLNVYNGSDFKIYKFAPDDPNTISNNVIRNIVEESGGIIWVTTDYGINRIDIANDHIDRFYLGYEQNSPTAEQVFSVAIGDGTIFCAATGWGIAFYDQARNTLSAFNIPQFNSLEIKNIYCIGRNTLLLHTENNRLVQIRYALSEGGGNLRFGKKQTFCPDVTSYRCSTAGKQST